MAKRFFDLTLSLAGSIIGAPFMLIIAVAILAFDGRPVLFRGKRIGRNGRLFKILKFRTMTPDAELRGGSVTANDDARITPIGRILRRLKFDELPQLWNVVIGDMSLIGPRPEVPAYVDLSDPRQKRIAEARPGITDWASIWDVDEGGMLEGIEDPDRAYRELIQPKKLALQYFYVTHRSLWMDIRILVFTLCRLVKRQWLPQELARFLHAAAVPEGPQNSGDRPSNLQPQERPPALGCVGSRVTD